MLLVASRQIGDPRFSQTVILVTRHGRGPSTIGVILNRPRDTTLDRLFPQVPQAAQHRLHDGGPVASGQLVFLIQGETAPRAAIGVGTGLFLSSDRDSLLKLLAAPTPSSRLRVFSGIASWAPVQLEHEIARGDWHVLPVEAEALFSDAPSELWQKLWRRATQIMT